MKIKIQEGKPIEIEDENGVTQMGVVEKIRGDKVYVRLLLSDKILEFDRFVERIDL